LQLILKTLIDFYTCQLSSTYTSGEDIPDLEIAMCIAEGTVPFFRYIVATVFTVAAAVVF